MDTEEALIKEFVENVMRPGLDEADPPHLSLRLTAPRLVKRWEEGRDHLPLSLLGDATYLPANKAPWWDDYREEDEERLHCHLKIASNPSDQRLSIFWSEGFAIEGWLYVEDALHGLLDGAYQGALSGGQPLINVAFTFVLAEYNSSCIHGAGHVSDCSVEYQVSKSP